MPETLCPDCEHSLAEHRTGGPMIVMPGKVVDTTQATVCAAAGCDCHSEVWRAVDAGRPAQW